MIPSSKKQRQMIAIGCSKLGISADLRHEMLQARFGVESSTLLNSFQADDFLKELRARGFRLQRSPRSAPRPPRARGANVVNLASAEQHAKITALSNLISWRIKDGFTRWLEKRFTIARVRTASEAWRVIEGLKAMFENQMKAQYGPGWERRAYQDPDIVRFIMEHAR